MGNNNQKKPLLMEVDLLQLMGKVLAKWKLVLVVTIVFMAIGVVMALSTTKEYTAQVVVAPESSTSDIGGGLASLASFAGIGLGTSSDAI